MNNNILLFFILLLSVGICTGEIIEEKTSSEYKKGLGGSNGDISNKGSSSPRIVFPSETLPMNVSWKIIGPKRDEGYYLDDVIVVQVTVTSVNRDGLKDIEIWEIPGNGIEVLNCSYPIVASSVIKILDYEKSDKSYLRNADLNISRLLLKFQSNEQPKEIKRIYELLPNDTQENITNIDLAHSNTSVLGRLKSEILREFNRILDNKSSLDLNASFFDISPTVLNYGLDYWISPEDKIENVRYIEQEDYRLIKRRLLEYAFRNDTTENSVGIRKLSFNKEHENKLCMLESINYFVPDLHNRESIILKYYLRPTKIGLTDLRSIVRSKDHLYEKTTCIKIVEPNPNFGFTCSCETRDLIKDTNATFMYSIKYLGGDKDETNKYMVNVSSPGHLKIISMQTLDGKKSSSDKGVNNKSIWLDFKKGMTQELIVTVVYNSTGYNFLPPKISIGRCTSDFEEDISVFEGWDMPFRVHTETFTLVILALTLFLSIFGSIILQYKQLKIMERDSGKREEESKGIRTLIENNTGALANLTKLVDQKMK